MCRQKIGENTTVFYNKFTRCHIKPNIYIQKTKFASYKQYLFRLLTTRNSKKDSNRLRCIKRFLTLSKEKRPKNLYKWQPQNLFSSVYVIGTTCFNECILFYCPYKMVWRTLITSCYKELINSLTKWLMLYQLWLIG